MEKRTDFSRYSWIEFEQLVFNYARLTKNWDSDEIEWLGHNGYDGGFDIRGVCEGLEYCYQCKNHQQLSFNKAKNDIDKLNLNDNKPDVLVIVAGGKVTNQTRVKIKDYAKTVGISSVQVWSAFEFDTRLRSDTPELLDHDNQPKSIQGNFKRIGNCINYKDSMDKVPMKLTLTNKSIILLGAEIILLLGISYLYNFKDQTQNDNSFLNYLIWILFSVPLLIFLFDIIRDKAFRPQGVIIKEVFFSKLYSVTKKVDHSDSEGRKYQTEQVFNKITFEFEDGTRKSYTISSKLYGNVKEGDFGLAYISEFGKLLDLKYVTYNRQGDLLLC